MRQRSFTACVVSAVALILCICACAESASAQAKLYVARRTKLPAAADLICGPATSPTAIVTRRDDTDGYTRQVITMRPDGSKLVTTEFTDGGWLHCSRNGRYGVRSSMFRNEDGTPVEDQQDYTFYELPSMKKLWTKEGELAQIAASYISDDGNMVVFADPASRYPLFIIDFHDKSGKLLKRISGPGLSGNVTSFGFDSRVPLFTVCKRDGTVTVYDSRGGLVGSAEMELGPIYSLYVNPDGPKLVVSCRDHLIMLNTKCELIYKEHIPGVIATSIVFSPDGKYFARRISTISTGGLELRDGATGRMIWNYELEELDPRDGERQSVGATAVDASGQRVALARSVRSNYGTIIRDQILLLDQSGKLIASTELSPCKSVSEAISAEHGITFSADGNELIVTRKSEIEYYRVEEARH